VLLNYFTLLISLDLSAAFDTIDHSILLSRLNTSFGLTGTVYSWLKSYLTDRYQTVQIGQHSSTPTLCTSGVPQGSVLGPLLFTIFTSPVSNIASLHNVHQHQYADDTQLFISLSPTLFSAEISNLSGCLSALNSWFCINGLALNPDKSDAIVLETRQRSASYSSLTSVDDAGSTIALADHIKVLGVTLDKHLTFDDHVNSVSKSAFYHIRAMRHIRPALTEDMAKTVACALVGARLDYANSVLVGVTTKNVARLQRAQNAVPVASRMGHQLSVDQLICSAETLSLASNPPAHSIQDCLHHVQDHPHHSACLSELCSRTLHSSSYITFI